jgi:hypothetical protein
MEERRGEKIGWIGGFLGGLLWMPFLSIFWLLIDRIIVGSLGLIFFVLGVYFIIKFSPWKYPDTKFYLLMLPFYIILILAIVLFVFFGWNILESERDFPLWSLVIMIPIFSPFFVMGWKTWNKLGK